MNTRPARSAAAAPSAGFSMLELLIAGALLTVISLGILPLFISSIDSNEAGAESSQISSHARSRLEEFMELPFNGVELTLDAGSEKVFDEYYSHADKEWKDGVAPVTDPAIWERTTTIRQFSAAALEDSQLDDGEALDSSTLPNAVHLKEILVSLQGTRLAGPLGPSKELTVRGLKSQ